MATGTSSPRTAAAMGTDGMQDPGLTHGVAPPAGLGAELGAERAAEQPLPASPSSPATPQRFVLSPDADDANDVKMQKLEAKIKELEAVILSYNAWIPALMESQKKKQHDTKAEEDKTDKDELLKPMHPKDMKPPPEFSGKRGDFLSWHESFSAMLKCKTPKWMQVIEWLKGRKEKRIMDGTAKEEFKKVSGHDAYVLDNLKIFQKHLYKYLLDYTKDKARSDVLAGKEKGVFEAYRAILHKCFNISEERRLDVLKARRT